MPVAPTYPGVYVEELPSGVHTITGVSTAVTAFVGSFGRGQRNVPTQIFSIADLERSFGQLVSTSEAGYAVRQFFANGGSQAWIVRVAGGSPRSSVLTIKDASGGTDILAATAASDGAWGDRVRLSVDFASNAPGSRFNLVVSEVDTSTPPVALSTETYRNLTLDPTDANYAVDLVNNASALIRLALVGAPGAAALPAASGTFGTDIHSLDLTTLSGETMTVELGTTTLSTTLAMPSTVTSLLGLAGSLQTQLRSLGAPPAMPSVTVALVAGAATGTLHLQICAPLTDPSQLFTFTGGLATSLGLATPAVTNVQQYALGGTAAAAADGGIHGNDGSAPDATAIIGDPVARTGLSALDTVDFNILCVPDTMNLTDSQAASVLSTASGYCASRWAFLVVDPPQASAGGVGHSERDSLIGVQNWLAGNATLRSSYSSLYYPRPQIPDPLNGYRLRSVAASGTVAGLYARTDADRGVWKAPAGTEAALANVAALSYQLTDAQNGVLNPLAINCLRSLPVYGNVCWGARTSTVPTRSAHSGSTSRCGGWPSTSRPACSPGRNGSSSSRTTSRCGPRSV